MPRRGAREEGSKRYLSESHRIGERAIAPGRRPRINPAVSPDGDQLAFQLSSDGDTGGQDDGILLLDLPMFTNEGTGSEP
jgi:hypothetical protein